MKDLNFLLDTNNISKEKKDQKENCWIKCGSEKLYTES